MTTVKDIVLALLWAVTLWRLPAAVRVPSQRALWGAFASIAAASTLGEPGIVDSIDRLAGIHNLTTLGKNLLGIVGSAAILDFVVAIARPRIVPKARRILVVLAAISMAALTVLFAITPRPAEVSDFYQANVGSLPGTAYCMVFTGCLGIAMTVATWLFWGYSRHAGAAWLRTGLRLLGTGTALGSLYSLLRTALMLLGLLHPHVINGTAKTTADIVENAAIALIIVGSSLPAVGVLWRSLRDWRALRRIQPLWASLTSAVPDIVLEDRSHLTPRVRLHRTVIEIRDAVLVLSSYVPEHVRRQAERTADLSGAQGEQRAALAEAIWLRTACAAKLDGADIVREAERQASPSAAMAFDFDAEVVRLLILSEAYHSPTAQTAARTHSKEQA
ncbi:MAB_1171c family putative transporter [Streptomyces sp. NPDC020096]